MYLPHTHTHTHTRLTALCPGLPGWACTRKVKPIWILLEQETVSGSGISWAICKSAPRSRQITTPAPHKFFLQAGCPSCRPTNSVKALKAQRHTNVPTTLWKKSCKSHFCSNLILKFHTAIKYILQSWSLLYYFTNDKLFTADVVRSLKIINVCYLQLKSTPVTVTAVIC